jgi:hypothetical protein
MGQTKVVLKTLYQNICNLSSHFRWSLTHSANFAILGLMSAHMPTMASHHTCPS